MPNLSQELQDEVESVVADTVSFAKNFPRLKYALLSKALQMQRMADLLEVVPKTGNDSLDIPISQHREMCKEVARRLIAIYNA